LEEYAIVRMSKDDFEKLPKEAVKGKKVNKYGVEALVLKSAVSRMFNTEYTTLEDIILFLAKGDRKQ